MLALPTQLVVTVYGGEYTPAATLLVGIAAYRLFRSQNAPLTQTVNGLTRPKTTMYVSAVALALNVVVGVMFVLRIGPIGIVFATLLAEVIRYLCLAVVVRRAVPEEKLVPATLLEQIGAEVIMFVTVLSIHGFVPVRSWLDLSLLIAMGAGTYGLVLLLISDRLRHTIGSVIRGSRIERFVPRPVLTW